MRPAPPAYPRPVPEIVFEDDSFSFESKVPRDDIDASVAAEQRAAKRRRIEAVARSYLRGEEVFILSAGLRGPLSKNWRNPWAKKSHVAPNDNVELKKQLVQQTSETGRIASTTPLPQLSLAPEAKVIHAVDIANPFQKTEPSQRDTSPAQKVEDWLRTSSAYTRQHKRSPLTSPTPKASTTDKPKSTNARWSATPPVRQAPTSSQVPPAPLGLASGKAFEFSQATTTDGMEVVNAADAHSRLQSILQMNSITPASDAPIPPASSCPAIATRPDNSTQKEQNHASLERTRAQQPPSSTDPILSSEHRELRSARRSKYLRLVDNSDGRADKNISERPTGACVQSQATLSKPIEHPQQSAPASAVASIEPLPSAQQRSEPLLLPQPSASEQPLPDIEVEQSMHDAVRRAVKPLEDQTGQDHISPANTETRHAQQQDQVSRNSVGDKPQPAAKVRDGYQESLQETEASEIVFITLLSENHNPEPQAEHPKTTKRTSFATSPDIDHPPARPAGSNTSLKSVLKTSKSFSSTPAQPKSPKSKSILKRNSTIASASSPTFSVPKQPQPSMIPSGQNVRGMAMNGDGDGGEFDLDAAVDDLGSFLSTWDEELGSAGA